MNLVTAIALVALIAVLVGAICKFNFTRAWTQIQIPLGPRRRFMIFTRSWVAASAAVAAAALCIALATWHPSAGHLLTVLSGSGFLFGVVTQNYLWPATGAASPTAAQVANQDSVVVDVVTDGVATTFTLTHNLGITAADLAFGWPDILIESNSPTGIPATLLVNITRPIATGNAVIFTCAAIAATFRVKIKRPHTIGR